MNFITEEGVEVSQKLFELVRSKDEINLNMLPLEKDMLEKVKKKLLVGPNIDNNNSYN